MKRIKTTHSLAIFAIAFGLASVASAESVSENTITADTSELLTEDSRPQKIVPIMALGQTSLQARDNSQVSSRGDFSLAAGALYEIPYKEVSLRSGLIYMPVHGKLISLSQQETILSLNQLVIPLEAQYQIARAHVGGLFLKGSVLAALKVSSKVEGSDSVVNSGNEVTGGGDMILGLGVVKTTPLNAKMDLGFEAQVLKGQLGYRLADQTIDQSAIQALVSLNIRQ